MSSFTILYECDRSNRPSVVEFLFLMREELYFSSREQAETIARNCFDHGGIFLATRDSRALGIIGYLLGIPSQGYQNKDTALIYVTGVLPEHRMTKLSINTLYTMSLVLEGRDVNQIQVHAELSNPYTNRLYSHFATLTGQSKNLRGYDVNVYESALPDVITYCQKLNAERMRTRKSGDI